MRRPDQYEFSAKVVFYSFIGLVTLLTILAITG